MEGWRWSSEHRVSVAVSRPRNVACRACADRRCAGQMEEGGMRTREDEMEEKEEKAEANEEEAAPAACMIRGA